MSITEADLLRFIQRYKLGVLSTVSGATTPQSALMGIAVTPGFEIIFDTLKTSRKYPNLISHPRCSFVIGWAGEVTVQFEGEAREVTGTEPQQYKQIYFQTWPDCRTHESWSGIVYFVVQPKWIRYSDFDQNPPLIQEFRF
jgi:pyridoxine/pyridoxamine 5'-phosphate oxidase